MFAPFTISQKADLSKWCRHSCWLFAEVLLSLSDLVSKTCQRSTSYQNMNLDLLCITTSLLPHGPYCYPILSTVWESALSSLGFLNQKNVSINMYKLFLQTAAFFGGLLQLALQVFWVWIWVHFHCYLPPCIHLGRWFPWLLLAEITVDHNTLLGCHLVQYVECKTSHFIYFLISSWHYSGSLPPPAVNILVWVKIDLKILLWESTYIFSLLW